MFTRPHITADALHRRALLSAGLALLAVIVLWNLPSLSFILYPLRLFVTFIHEAGHIIAAVLTGGQPLGFAVFPNGAGVAYTAGGWRAVILPAGYVGTALFGAALFYIANTTSRTRALTMGIGYGLVIFSIVFTLPNLLNGFLALTIGCIFGLILTSLARNASELVNLFALNLLSMMTGLNAVLDAFYLVRNPGAGAGIVTNDAAAFSAAFAPWVPASVWAFLWAVASVLLLGAAVYFSIIRPPRR